MICQNNRDGSFIIQAKPNIRNEFCLTLIISWILLAITGLFWLAVRKDYGVFLLGNCAQFVTFYTVRLVKVSKCGSDLVLKLQYVV